MTVSNVSAGNIVNPTWGNQVATDVNMLLGWVSSIDTRALPRFADEAARSAAITSPTEGMACVLLNRDRVEVYDGSTWVRGAGYSSSGRTAATGTFTATGVGSATTAQVQFGMTSDPDGIYTGFDGSNFAFTIPSGLPGIYLVTVNGGAGALMTNGGNLQLVMSGTTFIGPAPSGTNLMSVTGMKPMTTGQKFYVTFFNNHTSAVNCTGSITIVRVVI